MARSASSLARASAISVSLRSVMSVQEPRMPNTSPRSSLSGTLHVSRYRVLPSAWRWVSSMFSIGSPDSMTALSRRM
ncbi:hypothetical protein BE21_25630 [Sorangium cellulosum]|uniref:Uncharacterized protein n=1 Tax=Sorangium cellulosum TaxID=56 RepID=A0A150TTS7_SORCE|nr:hypothetical protein BE21_25630 [Sorangium cellulosum]